MAITDKDVKTLLPAITNPDEMLGKALVAFDKATGEAAALDNEGLENLITKLTPYHEEVMSYGVEIDTTNPLTALPRIGNLSLHRSLPIQSRMKGVLLNDDGEEVDYLHPTSWLGNTRDGSRGQVMVYIPDFYIKFLTEGDKRYVRMSEYPLPGYTYFPARYVSAYPATIS